MRLGAVIVVALVVLGAGASGVAAGQGRVSPVHRGPGNLRSGHAGADARPRP